MPAHSTKRRPSDGRTARNPPASARAAAGANPVDAARRERLVNTAVLLLVLLAAGALTAHRLFRPPQVYDEGIRASGAYFVSRGLLPYHDFYCIYGFADFLLAGGLLKLTGVTLLTIRCYYIAWQLGLSAAAFLLARRLSGSRWIAAAAAIACATFYGSYWESVLCVALTGMIWFHRYCDGGGRRALLTSAAIFAIAAWFRPDFGAYLLLSVPPLIVLRGWLAGRTNGGFTAGSLEAKPAAQANGRSITQSMEAPSPSSPSPLPSPFKGEGASVLSCMTDAGVFTAAFLGVILVGYAPFLLRGLDEVWRNIFTYPLQSLPGRRLPHPPLPDNWLTPYWSHVAVLLLTAGWLVLRAVRTRRLTPAEITCGLPLLVGALTLGYAFGRSDKFHQLPVLVLATMAAAGLAGGALRGLPRAAAATCVILLGAYVTFGMTLPERVGFAFSELRARLRQPPPRLPAAGWCRMSSRVPEAVVVDWILRNCPDEQYLFAGAIPHDRVTINPILFYFFTQKLPAVRDHHFDPLVTSTEEVQKRMIADLERHRPRVAALANMHSYQRESNASSRPSGVTLLDDYLTEHYEPVPGEFGNYVIAVRRPEK